MEYKIPKRVNNNQQAKQYGKAIGEIYDYRVASDPKTVYDPKVWSDDDMLSMAQQAAANGYEKGLRNYLNNNIT